MNRPALIAVLVVSISGRAAHGQAAHDQPAYGIFPAILQNCPNAFHSVSDGKSCGDALFNDKPIHLNAGLGVVPMSGVGIGAGGLLDLSTGAITSQMLISSGYTWHRFWIVSDTLKYLPRSHFGLSQHEDYRVYGLARYLRALNNYGEGAASPQQAYSFGGRESVIGTSARVPLLKYVDGATGIEFRHWEPTVGVDSARSIGTVFDEARAPGMSRAASYGHAQAGFTLHQARRMVDSASVIAGWYWIIGAGNYSFTRIEANFATGFGDSVNSLRLRSRLVLTSALAGDTVPFYYQPTLGQADIDGREDLRGYDNYRFRGLHSVLVQADYSVRVIPGHDWFHLMALADAGRVAMSLRELDSKEIRADIGAGIEVYLGGVPRAKLWVAHSAENAALLGTQFSFGY